MDKPSRKIKKDFARVIQSAQRLGTHITTFLEVIMADVAALQAKIEELSGAVSDDEAADAEVVARLNATIQELRDQASNNQPIDTQPLIDRLEEIKTSLVPAE